MNTFKALLFILVVFALSTNAHYEDHVCNHNQQEFAPELLDVDEDLSNQKGRILAETNQPANFRIFGHYEFLNGSTPSFKAYVQDELAPAVLDYYRGALKIKYPLSGNLVIPGAVNQICGKPVPSIFKGAGIPADYVIMFNANGDGGSSLAASKHCYLASQSKRPLVAMTTLNSNQVFEPKGNVLLHEKNVYLLMHEMLHTLGFSDKLYGFFLDENGAPRKDHIKSKAIDGKETTIIDLPPLTDRLRKHYGCPTLEGAYMENDGGTGSIGSHFERQYFLYEAMSTGAIDGRRMSEFSLALLEGSGWYLPNYEYAEPFFFGKDKGCEFYNQKCSVVAPPFEEFCVGQSRGCAPHGRGGGKCVEDGWSNGCRYYYPDEGFDCDNPDAEDNARLSNLQVFGRGLGSKCFSGTLNTRESRNGKTTFCFRYTCQGEGKDTWVDVHVGDVTVKCESQGPKSVQGLKGAVDCPDPLAFCGTVGKKYCPRQCMGRGQCNDGKCECNEGFTGIDCSMRI